MNKFNKTSTLYSIIDINAKDGELIIRVEEERDFFEVENLVRESFWNVYQPGCTEHFVLHKLRKDASFIAPLSFVMKLNGKIIGQNCFAKAHITLDKCQNAKNNLLPILTMGPICIANEHKRKGYGKILLDYSLQKATELSFGAVCIEGNIAFYGKSGFCVASAFNIRYHGVPEGESADFFLCKELQKGYLDGVSGVYATPEPYFAAINNKEEFEAFDAKFSKKQKLILKGQLGQSLD